MPVYKTIIVSLSPSHFYTGKPEAATPMGKQKIVVRVTMEDGKRRSKALKIAVGLPGVISAALDGEKIVVVGDGIDSVKLTVVLRRKMGFAELVSVSSAEEKKEVKKEEKKAEGGEAKSLQWVMHPYETVVWPQYQSSMGQQVVGYEDQNDPSCSIM